MPRCSIIIPVYNLAVVTRRCLDHLLAETCNAEREIIVVDDGSSDQTSAMLAGYGQQIRVVTHARNAGFATACNDGAAVAEGRDLVFLNNDTVPLSGWLDALVRYTEAHPKAAIVGAKLLYPDGTIQHAGMAIDANRHPRHIYVGFPADHPAVNTSRQFQIVTGGCFLVRREAFTQAGGFDTAFLNGFEDVDLCLRMGEMGHEVHYCHESVLFHLESVSEGRRDRDDRNHRLYRARWEERVHVDDWRYYFEDGLLRIDYPASCPLRFHVAPVLGIVDDEERRNESDRLLNVRARQVRDLLKENIALQVKAMGKLGGA